MAEHKIVDWSLEEAPKNGTCGHETCLATGVCSQHGVEVERRKSLKYIPGILTWVNIMKGYSILATIFIVGSFTYTHLTKAEIRADVKEDAQQTQQQIQELTRNVNTLTTNVARGEEKHNALLNQLETTNHIMMKMLEMQQEKEKIQLLDSIHTHDPKGDSYENE